MNRPKFPAAEDLSGLLQVRHVALLSSHLHDSLVLVLRGDHGLSFAEGMRERLLHIDVFSLGAGGNGHRHMPVVRRSDEHGVDIRPCEQTTIIRVFLNRLGVG